MIDVEGICNNFVVSLLSNQVRIRHLLESDTALQGVMPIKLQ